jgi:hypothetical protein
MRGITWAAGLILVAAAAAGSRAAGDDETYDLRGPAPKKGTVLTTKTVVKMKDAAITMKVMGETRKIKASMVETTEEEVKILAVTGRDVTRYQTRVVKQETQLSADVEGMAIDEKVTDDLEGETIISERGSGGKWKHTLVDTKPTEKQKKELNKRSGLENDDDLYPEGKFKVGHTWTVEASALKKVFGNDMSDVKGSLKQKFVRVEKVDGEECAVIESSGKVTGKMKDDDGEPTQNVEMDMTTVSWRSLKTGIELKGTLKGRFRLSGKQMIGGADVDMTIDGPMTGESTTKVK